MVRWWSGAGLVVVWWWFGGGTGVVWRWYGGGIVVDGGGVCMHGITQYGLILINMAWPGII